MGGRGTHGGGFRGDRSAWRAIALALALATLGCAPESPRPNLVIITLDTTRPDHLGPYGYARAKTPNLDRFAAGAIVYERAYATSSWTLPSHASLLTGLLPMQHGAQTAPDAAPGSLGYGARALAPGFVTLAEHLAAAGYRTGAVVAGPALAREFGLAQGFEFYRDDLEGLERFAGKRAKRVTDQATAILAEFGDAPFFLFVNFFDPHAPYRPPPPFDRGLPDLDTGPAMAAILGRLTGKEGAADDASIARSLEAMRAGYDAEIAYMDVYLGRLLEALEAASGERELLVAITSDHGESFGEHDYVSHGANLYEDNVRVPLLLRLPGEAPRREAEPVQNHWLFATLLDAMELPATDDLPRRSLRGGATPIVTQVGPSDANVRMFGAYFDRELRSVIEGKHKLIASSKSETPELFDLGADAAEASDLASMEPGMVHALEGTLDRMARAHPPLFDEADRAEIDAGTREALKALGYLDPDAPE